MVSCTNLKYSAPYLPCMPSGYSSIPLTSMPTINRAGVTVSKLVGTTNFKTIDIIKRAKILHSDVGLLKIWIGCLRPSPPSDSQGSAGLWRDLDLERFKFRKPLSI